MYVVDPSTMRALDAAEIESGTSSLDLMERAGRGIAESLLSRPDLLEGTTLIFCGKGNNGGDGLVVARLLHEAGHAVTTLCMAGRRSPDAAANWERARESDVEWIEVEDAAPADLRSRLLELGRAREGRLLVDALLGTGFRPPLRDDVAVWCEVLASLREPGRVVVAIDGPTGLGEDGAFAPQTCPAAWTYTLGAVKWPMLAPAARDLCGRIEVVDLGFSSSVIDPILEAHPEVCSWIDATWVARELPPVPVSSYKYSRGTVGVVGGSPGMPGAVTLACHGALRAGAGLVEALVPRSLAGVVDIQCVETLVRAVEESAAGGIVDTAAVRELRERRDVLVVGPGAGRDDAAVRCLLEILDLAREDSSRPMVVDADGLFALASAPRPVGAHCVLTPHSGELSRLLAVPAAEISSDRARWVREAAKRFEAVVLHKGAPTFVAAPDGRLRVIGSGGPGLATAGSGDVLSGVLGALLAQGMEASRAAAAAAWIHGAAGDRGERRWGVRGLVAGDLPRQVARVLRELEGTSR